MATDNAARGVESAVSASTGLTAAISVKVTGSTYTGTMTLNNKSAEPATNWQVLTSFGPPAKQNQHLIYLAFNGPSGAAGVTNAFVNQLGNNVVFTPDQTHNSIAPGGSMTVSWNGDWNGTTPSVLSVDGVSSGTPYAGAPADGRDPIALGAATAAFSIAFDYEKDKLSNNGDKNYALYDQTVWSAQSYRVASGNTTIEFDPNAPGAAFVPASAKADLAFAQNDAMVASYLTAGLVSCFGATTGHQMYAFRADFLKGFKFPGPTKGSVTVTGAVDNYTAVGSNVKGAQEITISATTPADGNFGILSRQDADKIFPTYWSSVDPKFVDHVSILGTQDQHGRLGAGCTPFNGPGGSNNKYFIITQNGSSVPAWYQGVAQDCPLNNHCTASLVIDPAPYFEPFPFSNQMGLEGTQSNPFLIDGNNVIADAAHSSQWATRTMNGVQEWGTFSRPVNMGGYTRYIYQKQM